VTSPDSFGVLTINLAAGPFAPGATDEGDGSSEIEITVSSAGEPSDVAIIGSSSADHITADDWDNRLNLNADEAVQDIDVTMTNTSDVAMIDTHEGDDTIETNTSSAHLIGGDGDDVFRSTDDRDLQIDGVRGDDLVSFAGNTNPVEILGGSGGWVVNTTPGDPTQQLSSIETVLATTLDDEITVGGDADVDALAGRDHFAVFDGKITVTGGEGFDFLDFSSPTAVTVDLQDRLGRSDTTHVRFAGIQVVTGTEGNDRFIAGDRDYGLAGFGGLDTYSVANARDGVRVNVETGKVSNGDLLNTFEAVVGSSFPDRILGSDARNILAGRGGNDVIRGFSAADMLLGGGGNDLLDGGPGADDCHGGPGTDTLVSC
jgi:Ca2+-binding RTX toxin-like protein